MHGKLRILWYGEYIQNTKSVCDIWYGDYDSVSVLQACQCHAAGDLNAVDAIELQLLLLLLLLKIKEVIECKIIKRR